MLQTLRNRVAGWMLNRAESAATVLYGTAGSGVARAHDTDPAGMLGNPLRSLTPTNAASMFEGALRGEWTRAQWLMFWVEQLDADVITLVERRCGGPKRLAWDIRTDASAKKRGLESLADDQADFLRAEYNAVDNLREALEHLGTARFRGFAHVRLEPTHWECLDQWWWLRDGLFGDWYWNPRALATSWASLGQEAKIDAAGYLIRVETRNMLFLALSKFLRANWSEKWWDKLIEICAKRGIVVIGPQTLPPEQKTAFEGAAANISAGGSGWLPNGSTIENAGMDLTTAGALPFEARLEWLSRRLILAGTGGMLTALNGPTGLGGSQGEEQGNVWRALLQQDGGDLSELLQAQFDKPRLAGRFPGQPVLAWFELQTADDPTPNAVLTDAELASRAGLQMDLEQLQEKTGYTLTLKPQAPAAPGMPGQDPTGRTERTDLTDPTDREMMSPEERAAMMANRRALRNRDAGGVPAPALPESWSAPVAEFFTALEAKVRDPAVTDADLAAWLQSQVTAVPELLNEMDVDALAATLERGMRQAAMAAVISGEAGPAPRPAGAQPAPQTPEQRQGV